MNGTRMTRRDAGVVELARLESVCTSKGYRGFESLSLRGGFRVCSSVKEKNFEYDWEDFLP